MSLRFVRVDRPAPYPPRISDATRPFWEALGDGRLTTTRCRDCGDTAFPPKAICPNCSPRVWAGPEVFGEELPYTVCVVDLDEGLRLGSRLLDAVEPEVGARVTLVCVHYMDATLFFFELYGAGKNKA